MKRVWTWGLAIGVVLLFAYSVWLRTTSLEHLPEVNGDEVWHAIQLTRMMRGQSFAHFTETGLPLSPIHALFEIPWLLFFKPSLWLVRMPAVTSSILAILCTYWLGSRIYDRTTALTASVLLAVLPVAIIHSRISYEGAHGPLYGIVLIYAAHRLRIPTVAALLALSYFVHPTNVFILPVLLAIVAVRSFQEGGDRSTVWLRMVGRAAILTAVAMVNGLIAMVRSRSQVHLQVHDIGLQGRHNFPEFLEFFAQMLLGRMDRPSLVPQYLFWGTLALVLVLGLRGLIRARQWQRVALVLGTVGSLLTLFLMGGSNSIAPDKTQYGLFLVTPVVLSTACLVRALLDGPRTGMSWIPAPVRVAGCLALAWALLLSVDLARVHVFAMAWDYHDSSESPWSFRSDSRAPWKRASSLILHDMASRPTSSMPWRSKRGGTRLVLTELWWHYGLLEWLMMGRRDVRVMNIHRQADNDAPKIGLLQICLARGGYVVALPDTHLQKLVRAHLPPEWLQEWVIPQNGMPNIHVYRLKGSAAAPRDVVLETASGPGMPIRR